MKSCLLVITIFLNTALFAQSDSSQIRVIKDARIDSLIKKQMEINEITTRDARRIVPGYRILVMNTQDRNEAVQAKSVVYQQFPDITPYLVYQAPYFKVKVGNFLTSEEAENKLAAIRQFFPKGVFVVKDLVEINPEKNNPFNQP